MQIVCLSVFQLVSGFCSFYSVAVCCLNSVSLPLQELSGSCESQFLAVVISNLTMLRLLLLALFLTLFVGITPTASVCWPF